MYLEYGSLNTSKRSVLTLQKLRMQNKPEAEFLDVIGTKVLLFTATSPNRFYSPPPTLLNKSGLKLVCNVNIVYGNLKSEYSHNYAQKLQ
jgi:hypothetical protein